MGCCERETELSEIDRDGRTRPPVPIGESDSA